MQDRTLKSNISPAVIWVFQVLRLSSLFFTWPISKGNSVPTIEENPFGKLSYLVFCMSIEIVPWVSETNIQDSIVPVTSTFRYPFEPAEISKDPLSKTTLIVLVKSAVVANLNGDKYSLRGITG